MILTVDQAAERLGVSTIRVRQFIHDGRLKAIAFGRHWAIEEKDLRAFARLKRRPGSPGGKTPRSEEHMRAMRAKTGKPERQ